MRLEILRQFWAQREPLERRVIAWGVCCASAALIVVALIRPAVSAIASLQRELPDTCAQAAQLDALLTEVRALRSGPAVAVASDAPAALEQSLAAAGLKAERVVPRPDGALQVTFADVPYGAWSAWLAAAERVLGMHAIVVTARATSTPGNADVALEFGLRRH
jgi:type II secretory pathway component PulM